MLNKNGIIICAAISLVFVVGLVTVVSANQSFKQLLANALAPLIAERVTTDLDLAENEEGQLGGMATDVYYPVQFHEGLYTTMHQDIAMKASSTLNVAADGNEAVDVMASLYFAQDMICDDVWLDVKTAVGTGSFTGGFSFSVGTTTRTTDGISRTNTTSDTIIASTTVAQTGTSEGLGMFELSNRTYPGTYYNRAYGTSSKLFLVNAGEELNARYRTQVATSGSSWIENDLTGTLHANCWAR